MTFTAVVVTHESARELVTLLDSIDRHLEPRPDVVVVDTGSTDGSVEQARGRAEVIELGANPGFGAANNEGVARSATDVTVLLNPDVVLRDDGLATLAERAANSRALLVPRLLNADGTVQHSAHPVPGTVRALLPALVHPRVLPRRVRLDADPWRSEKSRPVGWAIAACLAAPTRLLADLGPFDPAQFLFSEDLDLCLRARAAGAATVLCPDVALTHTGGHATGRAYGGEPIGLQARRRHEVVEANLGVRAARLDDAAQAITFATRAGARMALRRDASRERAQLAAVRRLRQDV